MLFNANNLLSSSNMNQQSQQQNPIIQIFTNNSIKIKPKQQFQKVLASTSTIYISQSCQILGDFQHKNEIEQQDLQNYQFIFSSASRIQTLERTKQLIQIEVQKLLKESTEHIYQQKIGKLQYIKAKEQQHRNMLISMKLDDPQKFQIIIKLIKFWSELKLLVKDFKIQDFSHKTFVALTKTKTSDLKKLLPTLNKIFNQGITNKLMLEDSKELNQAMYIKQFLIIPRFLISKEKIQHFVSDQQTQQQFLYLVKTHCLGHYNNQANKKMPDKNTITLLKRILQNGQQIKQEQINLFTKEGKQKFKTICTINHGNKFRKEKGQQDYQMLYDKTLKQLKQVEKSLKKYSKPMKSGKQSSAYSEKDQNGQINVSKSTLSEQQAFLQQLKKLTVSPQPYKRKIQSKRSLESDLSLEVTQEKAISKVKKLFSLRNNILNFETNSSQIQESQESFQAHLTRKIIQNIILIKPKQKSQK